MSTEHTQPESLNLPYALGLPGAGLFVGVGVLSLWYSFGYEVDGVQRSMADNLSNLGASGLDNLSLLDAADYSIGMVVAGALVMIFLNATAWRRTGGY